MNASRAGKPWGNVGKDMLHVDMSTDSPKQLRCQVRSSSTFTRNGVSTERNANPDEYQCTSSCAIGEVNPAIRKTTCPLIWLFRHDNSGH